MHYISPFLKYKSENIFNVLSSDLRFSTTYCIWKNILPEQYKLFLFWNCCIGFKNISIAIHLNVLGIATELCSHCGSSDWREFLCIRSERSTWFLPLPPVFWPFLLQQLLTYFPCVHTLAFWTFHKLIDWASLYVDFCVCQFALMVVFKANSW